MNILHFSTTKNWGGGEQQIINIMKELNGTPLLQFLICRKGSRLENIAKGLKFPYEAFDYDHLWKIQLFKKMQQIIHQYKINIIHTHDSKAHGYAVMLKTFHKNNVQIVVHKRVALKESLSVFSQFKYNHDSLKKIICVSNFVAERLSPFIKRKDRLTTIYSSFDAERILKVNPQITIKNILHLNQNVQIVANVGSLTKQKRQDLFIKAAQLVLQDKRVDSKRLFFIIIGDGPERQTLEDLIREKNLQAKVYLMGFQEEVLSLLSSADVLVSSSVNEAFGNIILEAFACKVPVVASHSGGVEDLIQDAFTGILAISDNPRSFADGMLRLLTDQVLREKIIEQAYLTLAKFSVQEMARKILAVYQE